MSTIEQLEARVRAARAELIEAQRSLHAAQLAAAPVKVGDIVRYTGQQTSRQGLHRVANVDVAGHNKPWVRAHYKKKDGEWSSQEHHLFDDWEIVTP